MAADRHFFNSLAGSIKTLSPVAAVAITAVYAISIYAFQPEVPEPPGNIVPVPTATPRKVKQIMPADINGDGPDRTRSTRERTETVNNNETLRTNGQSAPGTTNPAAQTTPSANRAAPGAPRGLLPYLEQSNVRTPTRTNASSNTAAGTASGGTTRKTVKKKTKTRRKN